MKSISVVKRMSLAVVSVVSLLSVSAFADGLPPGVSPGFIGAKLSTHTEGINKDVGFAITGLGTCKNFTISWGDGSVETIPEFNFGYGQTAATLTKTHKYTRAGKYFPSVAEVFGPSLADRCGSRTDVPDSSLSIIGVGNISSVTASNLTPKVGEAVSITLNGTLAPGQKCSIAGGTKSPYVDLGLISALPVTLPTTYKFDAPGSYYIHVYPGTVDKDNLCTQTGTGSAKVDVVAAPARAALPPPVITLPKAGK